MPRSLILALCASALVGAGLLGAGQTTTPAAQRIFELDPVHCAAMFRIHHAGAGQFWGRFNDVSGSVTYAEDDSMAPAFEISVAAESIDTGTEKLDRTLQSPNFFNRIEHPAITFKSTRSVRVDHRKWTVHGDLTLLGVSRPIAAEVEVTGTVGNPVQAKAGFEATFTIHRSDFGMTWGVDNAALGDEVRLVIALEGDAGPG